MKNLQPHQQRVVEELEELKEKFEKLSTFMFSNPIYLKLSAEEKDDLKRQYDAMDMYCGALERRIKRFKNE